jgi:hypothetical protein
VPEPLATLTDRLYADYQPGLTHADIDQVIRQCRADLAGTPPATLPELWQSPETVETSVRWILFC